MTAAARLLVLGPGLRRAVPAYGLFVLVELTMWLALVLWAYGRGGAAFASFVAIVQLLPAAVGAPLLSAIGDRIDRGRALTLAHAGVTLTTGLTALMLAVDAPSALVVTASTAATTLCAVVRPVHFAVMPQLARRPDELVAANAQCSAVEGVCGFAGPLLAGVGVAFTSVTVVFTASTAVAAAATALCAGLRVGPPVHDDEPAGSAFREATAGLRLLRRDPPALMLLVVMLVESVLIGALEIIGTAFATDDLGLGADAAGLLIGAVGIGSVVGALVASATSRRQVLAPVVVTGGLVQGVAFAAAGLGGGLVPAVLAVVGAGVGGAMVAVCGRTLLQRSTPDRVLARVFAVQESSTLVGYAIGAAAAPLLLGVLVPGRSFLPLGLAAVLLTVVGIGLLRRLDGRAVLRTEEIALLRRVPFLAALAPFEMERLAQAARWVEVGAGDVLVRQGETGEDFFVVADGELAVDVDGVRRPHTLRAGDGFGEIALLHAVPRTATVTAIAPARLLALGAPAFLAAVTGSVDGREVADDVAAAHLARDAAARA